MLQMKGYDRVAAQDYAFPSQVQYSSLEADLAPTLEVIESNTTREVILTGLKKFVEYQIAVLAYTRIGDGMLSTPAITVRTHEDCEWQRFLVISR